MSTQSYPLTQELYEYMLSVSLREPNFLKELRAETAKLEMRVMQISPEQGQFMQFLAKLIGAKRCLEVGVFTGYSALSIALALPENGQIIACDISEEWTSIARRYWKKAGVAAKIDLRLAPASKTLQKLLDQGEANQFDFAFIDANKTDYDTYYEQCLQLLRPGGLLLIDNTLWEGKVIDSATKDKDTVAIRALNKKLLSDERVDISLLPLSDGVTMVRKR